MTTSERPPTESMIQRVVSWLRAGYPDGVPPQDYVALLGILQRALTANEMDRVVRDLSEAADSGQAVITKELVELHIQHIVQGPPVVEDVGRVSARLAAAGWPLWAGVAETPTDSATEPDDASVRKGLVTRAVEWLRKGYPTGLPNQDFVPLIALLRRRLTDAEVTQVARSLVQQGVIPADRADVGEAIAKSTSELPSEEDIARVREYLTDRGWPVDFSV
jgi:hypothetical protein